MMLFAHKFRRRFHFVCVVFFFFHFLHVTDLNFLLLFAFGMSSVLQVDTTIFSLTKSDQKCDFCCLAAFCEQSSTQNVKTNSSMTDTLISIDFNHILELAYHLTFPDLCQQNT